MSLILSGSDGVSDIDGSASTPAIRGTDANTGIFFPAADTIAFAEGGAESMRIDASGNVGIGTTSLTGKFTVRQSSDATNGGIVIEDTSGGGAVISRLTDGGLTFRNGGLERARITSGGDLLVGVTSGVVAQTGVASTNNIASGADTAFALTVSNSSGSAFGFGIKYTSHSPNNAGNSFVWCADGGGTQRAAIYSNGGLANYSANNVNLSDRREKTNFAPATAYLDKICAIPVQTFNYIDQNLEQDDGLTLGVVAQDVQEVAPELVMESNWAKDGDDPKMRLSIYQTDLQYALMKCIQELKAELDTANTRLAALENK